MNNILPKGTWILVSGTVFSIAITAGLFLFPIENANQLPYYVALFMISTGLPSWALSLYFAQIGQDETAEQ